MINESTTGRVNLQSHFKFLRAPRTFFKLRRSQPSLSNSLLQVIEFFGPFVTALVNFVHLTLPSPDKGGDRVRGGSTLIEWLTKLGFHFNPFIDHASDLERLRKILPYTCKYERGQSNLEKKILTTPSIFKKQLEESKICDEKVTNLSQFVFNGPRRKKNGSRYGSAMLQTRLKQIGRIVGYRKEQY